MLWAGAAALCRGGGPCWVPKRDLQEGRKQWGGGGGEKGPRREEARVAWERN